MFTSVRNKTERELTPRRKTKIFEVLGKNIDLRIHEGLKSKLIKMKSKIKKSGRNTNLHSLLSILVPAAVGISPVAGGS